MQTKVAKFGGTSLASVDQIIKVVKIINSDPSRRIIVVSAPGKRFPEDQKVTDMLYRWGELIPEYIRSDNRHIIAPKQVQEIMQFIHYRYHDVVDYFNLNLDVAGEMDLISQHLRGGASVEYLASRGEYLMAKILAELLCCQFVDPAHYIHIHDRGNSYEVEPSFASVLQGNLSVVAGFYGSDLDGKIKTFSRGGSDITGAIVASVVGAQVYENWTDVSGMLMADPKIVIDPRPIRCVTYAELRELAYMGANVFHEEAMFPVQDVGIPTNIRNTNCPDDEGTWIVPDNSSKSGGGTVSGIAGRKNFTVIRIEKRLMNKEIGFGRRILSVLEEHDISFEHMPGGIDTVSVVVASRELDGKVDEVVSKIRDACSPDRIEVQDGLAMIAIVGRGMIHTVGTSARALEFLASASINIRILNQGSSEMSIIIGVQNADFENAIRALYRAFVSGS